MRALIQRVAEASVKSLEWPGERKIDKGLVILLGIAKSDTASKAHDLALKAANLRIFSNSEGKFDHSVIDIKGECLIISQFTLYGDTGRGRRPDFALAAPSDIAKTLYQNFTDELKKAGVIRVETGEFQSRMQVHLINDGPVTLMLEV
ncbi:MAG: D-tyrosyl-tRNA(Tyr) deacylase [Elusimicrobia bacterium]|nr:D-tyrosyl-tRNA(Tyr) deacylase [Elusimicrobiota bacterium]